MFLHKKGDSRGFGCLIRGIFSIGDRGNQRVVEQDFGIRALLFYQTDKRPQTRIFLCCKRVLLAELRLERGRCYNHAYKSLLL